MLYEYMKESFIRLLAVFGVSAVIFAVMAVYHAYTGRMAQHAYKRWLIAFFSLACLAQIVLFIRVTVPYRIVSDTLLIVFFIPAIGAAVSAFISLRLFLREADTVKSKLRVDILKYIDDFVLVFDRNGEVVYSTCPNGLTEEAGLIKDETMFEIKFGGEWYLAAFSPIVKDSGFVGAIGIFHQISDEKKLLTTLMETNRELSEINDDLAREVSIDDALLVAEQQKTFALEIQKELEKKITALLFQISEFYSEHSADRQEDNLASLSDRLRTILADIRKIVYGR